MRLHKADKADEEMKDIQDEKTGENTRALRQIIVNWVNEHIKPADRKTDQHKNGIYCKNVRFQHPVSRKNSLTIQIGDRVVDTDHPVRSVVGATVNAIRSTEINQKDKSETCIVESTMSFEYTDSYKLSVGSKLGFGIKAGVPCVDLSFEAEVGMTSERVNEGKESQSQTVKGSVLIPANSKLDVIRQFKTMDLIENFIIPLTLSGTVLVYLNYEADFDVSKLEFVKTGKKIKLTPIEVPIIALFADGTLQPELRKEGIHFKAIDHIRKEVQLTIGYVHTTHQRHFVVDPVGEPVPLLSEAKISPRKESSTSTGKMIPILTDTYEFRGTVGNLVIEGQNDQLVELAREVAKEARPVAPEMLRFLGDQAGENRKYRAEEAGKSREADRAVEDNEIITAANVVVKASPSKDDSHTQNTVAKK